VSLAYRCNRCGAFFDIVKQRGARELESATRMLVRAEPLPKPEGLTSVDLHLCGGCGIAFTRFMEFVRGPADGG
jgi:hypothetical protein